MTSRLKDEIQQNKPFSSAEQEAFLNIVRTADHLMRQVADVLEERGLTPTQYNVLRILRGAGEAGLNGCDIAARMISGDPDVARLLDRMEKHGHVERSRDNRDRRYVTTRITPAALQLLSELDDPMTHLTQRLFSPLQGGEIRQLIDALERLRATAQESGSEKADSI